jgi:type I restriction enzyme M protein
MKFAAEKAHDGGEFYTPVSLVQTIVNVIEPDHGIVFDPACGSAGMLVQSSHFMEKVGKKAHKAVTFYGQEKSATTIRFAKMNLAVHGLEGKIIEGNSYYTDAHALGGKADFVMANPPFNVDEIDAEKVKNSGRLPFGLPGVNKKKKTVSNGNYIWISYFYAYLNSKGRAGFVMSSQASSAGHGEKEVRRKIVETGHADVMIAIRSNFFYTRTVPCELWFFDKGKPKERLNKVLMIDARNLYHKVSRKVNDFSPEQEQNLTAIVWLYRGESDRYLGLVKEYLMSMCDECGPVAERLAAFETSLEPVSKAVDDLSEALKSAKVEKSAKEPFEATVAEWTAAMAEYSTGKKSVLKAIRDFLEAHARKIPEKNGVQIKVQESFASVAEKLKQQVKLLEHVVKLAGKAVDAADTIVNDAKNGSGLNSEKGNDNDKKALNWDTRAVKRMLKDLEAVRDEAVAQLRRPVYFHHQAHWLQTRFPDAKLADVEGLVKLVDRKEIKANDWSLTPGRYVGVAQVEDDEEFDFEDAIRGTLSELNRLNMKAAELAKDVEAGLNQIVE